MTNRISADREGVRRGAEVLRQGGLVAFPTETVYGLGANALDTEAVARIFAAKERPGTNPLIVHLGRWRDLARVASDIPDAARLLMRAFWPGPLTLVLPKSPEVPDLVTAGGPTVGVRMPRHPVALRLIRAAGLPVAAPSANRSEEISPTRADHVAASLGHAVDLILDGGPCAVGLESTVLDVTVWPPRLLRPGMLQTAQIEAALGAPLAGAAADGGPARSPGQMLRHYAPRTPLRIVSDVWADAARTAQPAVLAMTPPPTGMGALPHLILPRDPDAFAAGLYAALHTLDAAGADEILVERVPASAEWQAIRDRLRRAAHPG